jgi:hypothetical protein
MTKTKTFIPIMNSEDSKKQRFKNILTSTDWVDDYSPFHVDIDIRKSHVFDDESDSDLPVIEKDTDAPMLLELEPNNVSLSTVTSDWAKQYNAMFGVVFSDSVSSTTILPDESLVGTSLDMAIPTKIIDSMFLPEQTTNSTSLDVSIKQVIEQTIAKAQVEKSRRNGARRKKEPQKKEYVENLTDLDVLCGRGGKSNHHNGNKKYRDEVGNLQQWYKSSEKNEKTDLSQCLVNYVHSYGGRFLKMEESNKRWYLVTNHVARRKASQALREHATPEERAAKRALMIEGVKKKAIS